MYKVLITFRDLQDNGYRYHVGDEFPHKGLTVDDNRLEELSTDKNRRGIPVIEKIVESEPVKEVEEVKEVKPEESAPKPRRGRKKNVE